MQAPPGFQPQFQPPAKKTNWVLIVLMVGMVAFCCGGVLLAVLFPVFAQARQAAISTACMSNLKRTSAALAMYARDNDDMLPPAKRWMDGSVIYQPEPKNYRCPAVEGTESFGYAFNAALSGKIWGSVQPAATTPFIFDSTLNVRNAASGSETLPVPGRHARRGRSNNIAFEDGHVSAVSDRDRTSFSK